MMWRFLPLVALMGCAATGPDQSGASSASIHEGRVVSQVDLPLTLTQAARGPAKKTAEGQGRLVWIEKSGTWGITTTVTHTRLRCATYETGIQLGQGSPNCANARWLTPLQLGTRQTHCNSATRIHSGGGTVDLADGVFGAANCVRIVTRCDGPC